MDEKRWGEEWNAGDRIRYVHPERHQLVEGEIKARSWSREKGKPIYLFTVVADGEKDEYVIPPNRVQPVTSDPLPDVLQASPSKAEPKFTPAEGEYPLAPPKETGFGPLDSDNWKEWNKGRREWEAQQGDATEEPKR